MSSPAKYITAVKEQADGLSAMAGALVIPMLLSADVDNHLHKRIFIRNAGFKLDPRTWNKYWRELRSKGVIRHIDGPIWMFSPEYGYSSSADTTGLFRKWNDLEPANESADQPA